MPRMKIHQLETQEACTHEVSLCSLYLNLILSKTKRLHVMHPKLLIFC